MRGFVQLRGLEQREAGVLLDLLETHARVQRTHLHRTVRVIEIQDAQVADHAMDVHQVTACTFGPALGLEADTGDHVHFAADKHPRVMAGHEERVEVVDAVAGQAAHAKDRGLGLLIVADTGQVGLAPAVDLGRPDHRVAASAPHAFEDPLERHVTRVTRHVVTTWAQRDRFFYQERLAVGHQ
ncbi:hypothetical protein D3C87_1151490 [compost metagenome]